MTKRVMFIATTGRTVRRDRPGPPGRAGLCTGTTMARLARTGWSQTAIRPSGSRIASSRSSSVSR